MGSGIHLYVWNQNWNQDTCFGRKRKTPIRIRGYSRLNQQLIALVPVLGSENQTATGVRFWELEFSFLGKNETWCDPELGLMKP